jgi:hypothetical protein
VSAPEHQGAVLAAPPGWPEPPEPAAYHGLAGAVVQAIAPHTEADPVAILGQLLVAFGSAVGRGAYFTVEATRHHPNEFLVLVGDSSKARKGSSWDRVATLIERVDPGFALRSHNGLSTGEGLIWAVRDPAGSDPGAPDPRLLVIEPEFVSVLRASARELSSLSPVLRSAWDGRPLQLITRSAPARASAAHVAVIGHVTAPEFRAQIDAISLSNGFMNRFVLLACRRTRLLPEGGDPNPLSGSGAEHELAAALRAARRRGQVGFSLGARIAWWEGYEELSSPADGLVGAMTARGEAHVLRLALIYALLDHKHEIDLVHLTAALALWDYAVRSAAWAFGSASGDPLAEQIHAALAASPVGLTRTELRDLFHHNQPVQAIDQALAVLARARRVRAERVPTAGRPAERWHNVVPENDNTREPASR